MAVIELKTPGEIDAMHAAGVVVADTLAAVQAEAKVGVSLLALDEVAREVLAKAGATSPFLGYQPGFAKLQPFPAVICTSVNDAVLHGIPDGYRLRDGDLLSIDFGAVLDGWAGDAATSFSVGQPRRADQKLITVAGAALAAGIAAAIPGARIGDISAAIGQIGGLGATASTPTSAGTASAMPCTNRRRCPTRAGPAGAQSCSRAWSSRSSRGSWPVAVTSTASTAMAGHCAAATARAARTSSTPSRSPRRPTDPDARQAG